jgi:hypothetical protein
MASSKTQTVEEYLNELAPDRRRALAEVRSVILCNLPEGYEETVQFGMISYVVPVKRFPITYNKQPLTYAALASQKNYMSLYLMNVYGDKETEKWFKEQYTASGKKLDMGKSCVRFKTLEDLPLDLVGQAIARTPVSDYLERYEASRLQARRRSKL